MIFIIVVAFLFGFKYTFISAFAEQKLKFKEDKTMSKKNNYEEHYSF